jgi:hypothetical protein
MADIALSSRNLAQTIRNQAWRIWEDALYCSAGHFQESRWWQGINLWMGIPTTIIAAITGITSLADSGSSPLILGLSSNLIVPVLSFTVAAISGLSTFLDPTGQASKHYQAASQYQTLVNDIRLFCEVDCAKECGDEQLEEGLRKFNARLNELNSQPLIISKQAKQIAEKEIKSGKFNYRIDKEIPKTTAKQTAFL